MTGSNRSGTTWVGEALCQSDELEYLHEPFNPSITPRLLERRPAGHYHYVCEDNGAAWAPSVERLLAGLVAPGTRAAAPTPTPS